MKYIHLYLKYIQTYKENQNKFGRIKSSPYICKTVEMGNDLDTSFNFFTIKFGRVKNFY